MGILLKPCFAALGTLVALGLWAFTVGPWGPWHERTIHQQRLVLAGEAYTHHSQLSAPFTMGTAPSAISLTAALARTTGPATTVYVGWSFVDALGRTMPWWGRDESLSPYVPSVVVPLEQAAGTSWQGQEPYRLRLEAIATAGTVVTAGITETRGYISSVPLAWPIALAGLAYIGATVLVRTRGRPPKTLVVPAPGHERY